MHSTGYQNDRLVASLQLGSVLPMLGDGDQSDLPLLGSQSQEFVLVVDVWPDLCLEVLEEELVISVGEREADAEKDLFLTVKAIVKEQGELISVLDSARGTDRKAFASECHCPWVPTLQRGW